MEKRINPLDYLPELYQNCENSFTERFLTIFTDILNGTNFIRMTARFL